MKRLCSQTGDAVPWQWASRFTLSVDTDTPCFKPIYSCMPLKLECLFGDGGGGGGRKWVIAYNTCLNKFKGITLHWSGWPVFYTATSTGKFCWEGAWGENESSHLTQTQNSDSAETNTNSQAWEPASSPDSQARRDPSSPGHLNTAGFQDLLAWLILTLP